MGIYVSTRQPAALVVAVREKKVVKPLKRVWLEKRRVGDCTLSFCEGV